MKARRVVAGAMLAGVVVMGVVAVGCSSYKRSGGDVVEQDRAIASESREVAASFREKDPTLERFFESAHAYAVFPVVSQGAAGIGASRGNGAVFRGEEVVGYATVTQVTIGAQLGGQTFSQLIFFEHEDAFANFKDNRLKFAANASVVAAESGAAAKSDFADGVAVFAMPRGGLMFEASIGGQGFRYRPAE